MAAKKIRYFFACGVAGAAVFLGIFGFAWSWLTMGVVAPLCLCGVFLCLTQSWRDSSKLLGVVGWLMSNTLHYINESPTILWYTLGTLSIILFFVDKVVDAVQTWRRTRALTPERLSCLGVIVAVVYLYTYASATPYLERSLAEDMCPGVPYQPYGRHGGNYVLTSVVLGLAFVGVLLLAREIWRFAIKRWNPK